MTLTFKSVGKINYFFKEFFNKELEMEYFDNRIKLQKLIYILSFYGIKFNYNFTWWKHGPYSPNLTDDGYLVNKREITVPKEDELKIIEKLKGGKQIIKDSRKAELIASYLYMNKHIGNNPSNDAIISELTVRKPYLNRQEIEKVMSEWKSAITD